MCAALFQRPQNSPEAAEHVNRVEEETLGEPKGVCSEIGVPKIKEEPRAGAKLLAEGNLSGQALTSGNHPISLVNVDRLLIAVRSQMGQTISGERNRTL